MKNLKYYLNKTLTEHFAMGAFNFSSLETLQAICAACKKLSSPAFISVSEGALEYMGENFTISLAKEAKNSCEGLFLHLDHGKNFDICKKAVDLGFDSVMIDGSNLSFDENVKLTKRVATYAHSKCVLVEGELGQIKGIEEDINKAKDIYTDPQAALDFAQKTDVDMLAISIGTSHGAYKFQGKSELRLDILAEIEALLPNFPLVLHGASTVDEDIVDKINQFGGNIKKASGVSPLTLQKVAQEHNIAKINTDTDLRLALTAGVREVLSTTEDTFDPRKYLSRGRDYVEQTVENKIKNIFMSSNKI